MDRKALALQREIERIKKELAELGDLRPGSLSKQYNVCGKPACRCKASPPVKHGPYYQVSYTRERVEAARSSSVEGRSRECGNS